VNEAQLDYSGFCAHHVHLYMSAGILRIPVLKWDKILISFLHVNVLCDADIK
jgi:hypothetical protein